MSRVQRGAPVSVNLLCGGKTRRRSHRCLRHSTSSGDGDGRVGELTLAGTAPAVQAEDGFGGNEEGKGAGLKQRESKQTPSAVSR